MAAASDLNLVFGMIALQCDFLTKEQLFAGMQAWIFDKSKSLGEILVAQKALDGETRGLLDSLVKKHLAQHGGDPERSLAALSSRPSAEDLLRRLPDPDVQASVDCAHARGETIAPGDDFPTIAPADAGIRFRILRPHAKGGLGVVYVALDREVRREVALKEIQMHRAGDPDSRARFLLEAEITGGLEHPGIVPIYGLGRYPDGRPYYAMRFIQGDSLLDAAKAFHAADETGRDGRDATERDVSLKQLLRRFIDVCNAVEYAHSKGVLHRDLKPANVMLGKFGETLVVDWGLAKATGKSAGDASTARAEAPLEAASASLGTPTVMGSTIGTPAYMSPEQAAGRLDLLSAASDVYSLGATLYHVLTGQPPVTGDSVESILKNVQDGRFPHPRTVKRALDPALDAVCLKAMALEPEARYGSAAALSKDVENWIADAPVSARPDPISVKARRWVVRHRVLVATTVAALLVALLGLGALAIVTGRANDLLQAKNDEVVQANDKLATAVDLAETRRSAAVAAEGKARAEAELSAAGRDFLRNDLLRLASPDAQAEDADLREKIDPDLKVRDLLLRAGKRIEGRFPDRPLVERDVRETIGLALLEVGLAKEALPHLTRVLEISRDRLGPDDFVTLRSINNLANCWAAVGRGADALKLHEEALKLRKAKLGADDPNTLLAMSNLANSYDGVGRMAEALHLREETLKLRKTKLGRDHPDTLTSMNALGKSYADHGRTGEALKIREETLKLRKVQLGPDHPETLSSMRDLASSYADSGRAAEAVKLREETLELQKAKLGRDHPDTLRSMNNLAISYADVGRAAEALKLREQTLELRKSKLGHDHPDTVRSMYNLAFSYAAAARTAEALKLFEQTLELRKAQLGPDHPDTLSNMYALADFYVGAGRAAEALKLFEQTLELQKAKLGADHPETLKSMHALGNSYFSAGRVNEALKLREQTVELQKGKLGPDHRTTLRSMNNLAISYAVAGRAAEALQVREQMLELQKAKFGPDDPDTIQSMAALASSRQLAGQLDSVLALAESALEGLEKLRFRHFNRRYILKIGLEVFERAGKLDRAETWRRKSASFVKESTGPDSTAAADELFQLGDLMLRQNKYAEAESVLRECLVIRDKKQPEDWKTSAARGMLGAALLGQKKLLEADPFLTVAYREMKKRSATLPLDGGARLIDAAECLARLLEAADRPGDAAQWTKTAAAERERIDGPKLEPIHVVEEKLELTGTLSATAGSAIHQVRLKTGVVYVIDMTSSDPKALDPYLQVRDEAGKVLAEDDDSGGSQNARIGFRPSADGVYQLRATSFARGAGTYTLTIRTQK